jgi:hypothetical protein
MLDVPLLDAAEEVRDDVAFEDLEDDNDVATLLSEECSASLIDAASSDVSCTALFADALVNEDVEDVETDAEMEESTGSDDFCRLIACEAKLSTILIAFEESITDGVEATADCECSVWFAAEVGLEAVAS